VTTLPPGAAQEGETRGETRAIVRIAGLKLGRPLTEAERGVVTARVADVGPEAVERALVQLDRAALERWLAAPRG
jgi:hypothetical protein